MDRLDTLAVTRRTYRLLRERLPALAPLAGLFALGFILAGAARWLLPGLYVFNPFDMGWLLIPEALWFGPLLALAHHRILAPERAFAWSPGNRLLKFAKSAAYAYVLAILLPAGVFAATQAVPALLGYVLGPVAMPFYPAVVAVGAMVLLLGYVRLLFPFAELAAADAREPMARSILLTRGKARKIASCLLLPAAPVLIPWVALAVWGGDWLDPAGGMPLRPAAIVVRAALQTAGALLISTALCATHEALAALEGDTESHA
ncbi:MAG: hypothetical protein V3571_08340 [Pseudodesulfovibrio sp.]